MTFSSWADGHVGARVAGGGAVLRLVLHRDRVHRDAVRPVGLDELQQVERVGAVDARVVDEAAADQGAVRLHPRGRAPRAGDDLQVRVERLGLAEQRQDLGLVVGDGEVLLGKVGLPGGQVVVGVVGGGDEVAGPDRLAQVVQAVAGHRVEQGPHGGRARRRGQPVEHGGRRVGDGAAEALHPLVGQGRVDDDGGRAGHRAAERGRGQRGELVGAVRGGHPDVRGHRSRAGGRGRADREGGGASGGHRGAQRGHDESDPRHRRPIM